MHHLNADPQMLAQFLPALRQDWNLGAVAIELDRPELSALRWPDLVVTAVQFAADEDHPDPRRLHEPGAWWPPQHPYRRSLATSAATHMEAGHGR